MREPGEECVREGALRGDHRLQARPRRRKGPCDAEASVRSDESVEYVRVHIARKRIRCGQPPADGASYGTSDRKSTRLNSSHVRISYAVFCLKKKNIISSEHLAFQKIRKKQKTN